MEKIMIVIEEESEEYKKGFRECLLETIALMKQHLYEPMTTFIGTLEYAVEMLEKKNENA
jgi:hypothetical protein